MDRWRLDDTEYSESVRRKYTTILNAMVTVDVDEQVALLWDGWSDLEPSSGTTAGRCRRPCSVASAGRSTGCSGETPTSSCTQRIHMATIRVSEEVKERLESLKRDDETFSELLDRLSRREKDVEEMAGFLEDFDDGDLEDDVTDTHDALNESLQSR